MKGFRHHLRHCRRSIDVESSEDLHRLIANPTLSIHSSSDVFAPNRTVQSDEDSSYNNRDLIETFDSYEDINEDNSGFHPLRRKTMAVTKFQVMLNDLLLKHKASLLLYDKIIELVSMYILSPSFNKLDKFKSRRSLLQSTEKSLNTSCLRPVNGTVRLHNDSLVTVPIFDAKHMITSMLTDPSLMKECNFAKGYNVLTGEVQNEHPDCLYTNNEEMSWAVFGDYFVDYNDGREGARVCIICYKYCAKTREDRIGFESRG